MRRRFRALTAAIGGVMLAGTLLYLAVPETRIAYRSRPLEAAFEKAKREMKKDTLGIYVSRDPWNSTHVVTGDLKEVCVKLWLLH